MDGMGTIHLCPVEPGPNVAKKQADRSSYCKRIAVEITFSAYLPAVSYPVSHALGHGGCRIPNTGRDCFGRKASPITNTQCYFWQSILLCVCVSRRKVVKSEGS